MKTSFLLLACLVAASPALDSSALRKPSAQLTPRDAKREARIEGKVSTAPGEPISGVNLRLEKDPNILARKVKTDTDGKYSLSAPAAGIYRIRLEKDGFRSLVLDSIN